MAAGESYTDGLCRMLRSMVGKTTVSTQRRSIESEWTLTVTIGDAPPWLRSDNWMLPIHAADAIERLGGELFPIRKELEQMRTERNQARAELCIMHPRAEDPVAYARSRGWNDLFKDEA